MEKNTYRKLKNKHEGEKCFILGSGPSLYNFYKSKYFEKIFDEVIISVNASIMLLPWEDNRDSEKRYWISNDALCRRWSWWQKVLNSSCTKIVRDSWEKYQEEIGDFLYFSPRPTSEDIINSKDEGLCYCSSVPSAIDLAIQMGCKEIYIFGLDHKKSKEGYSYFWEYFAQDEKPTQIIPALLSYRKRVETFNMSDKSYMTLLNFSKDKEVIIQNCNINSEMKIFSFCDFEKIFVEK